MHALREWLMRALFPSLTFMMILKTSSLLTKCLASWMLLWLLNLLFSLTFSVVLLLLSALIDTSNLWDAVILLMLWDASVSLSSDTVTTLQRWRPLLLTILRVKLLPSTVLLLCLRNSGLLMELVTLITLSSSLRLLLKERTKESMLSLYRFVMKRCSPRQVLQLKIWEWNLVLTVLIMEDLYSKTLLFPVLTCLTSSTMSPLMVNLSLKLLRYLNVSSRSLIVSLVEGFASLPWL